MTASAYKNSKRAIRRSRRVARATKGISERFVNTAASLTLVTTVA